MPYFYNDGHKLYYRERGRGNLLIILPGNTTSSANYVDDINYFSDYFHTVSLDFWGTGKSDRLNNWTRNWWTDAAKDVIRLIDYLEYDSASIIGCSGGAAAGLLAAALYPSRIQTVIADSELDHYLYDDLIKLCIEERKIKSKEQIDFWQEAHGDDWEDVVQEDNNLMLDVALHGHIFKDNLRDVTCPILFCGSLKEEQYIPYFSETMIHMTKQIKKAELFLVNDGNHPLMWSCKSQFRRVALSFLQSVSSQNCLENN